MEVSDKLYHASALDLSFKLTSCEIDNVSGTLVVEFTITVDK